MKMARAHLVDVSVSAGITALPAVCVAHSEDKGRPSGRVVRAAMHFRRALCDD